MFRLSARRILALHPNYVCPRCTLDGLASQGCSGLRPKRALHQDSHTADDDAFPMTTNSPASSSRSGKSDRVNVGAEADVKAATRPARRSRKTTRPASSKAAPRPRRPISYRPFLPSRNGIRPSSQKTASTPLERRIAELISARRSAVQAVRRLRESSIKAHNDSDGILPAPRVRYCVGATSLEPDEKPTSLPANEKHPKSSPAAVSKHEKLPWVLFPHLRELKMEAVNTQQQQHPPRLSYGLDRVLFNPGVYRLQDPRSLVYNFDPYLEEIMPVEEFDYDALREYVTSSKDEFLSSIAGEQQKKYTGSTSSMTNMLSHLHFLLSSWRAPNMSMLSSAFPAEHKSFTLLSRAPAASMLILQKNGTYSLDADKEFSTSSVLSLLGQSMEKLLTLDTDEYEQYRKTRSNDSSQPPKAIESYHYTTVGDFLFRSQLDAYDPRLPGAGIFDVKTRAVVSVRMDSQDPNKGSGYEIVTNLGEWESFEREYYDLIRAAFLKYSLQVRMGRMDGIFVAYHNTKRIFGFQYIPISEMDFALHGQTDPTLGDQEFRYSMGLLNKLLDEATERFPNQSLRLHMETRGTPEAPFMYFIAEPVSESQIEAIQNQSNEDNNLADSNVKDASSVESEPSSKSEAHDVNRIISALAEARNNLNDSWATIVEENPSEVTGSPTSEHDIDVQSEPTPSSSPDLHEMATLVTRADQHLWDSLLDEEIAEDDLTVDLAEHIYTHDYGVLETLEGAIDASMRGNDDSHNIDRIEDTEEEPAQGSENLDGSSGYRSPSGSGPEALTGSEMSHDANLLVLKVRVMHMYQGSSSGPPPQTLTSFSVPWQPKFHIQELGAEAAGRTYGACKGRRKVVLERSSAFTGAYLDKLRKLSSRGKARRSRLDAKQAASEKVVFSSGSDAPKQAS